MLINSLKRGFHNGQAFLWMNTKLSNPIPTLIHWTFDKNSSFVQFYRQKEQAKTWEGNQNIQVIHVKSTCK